MTPLHHTLAAVGPLELAEALRRTAGIVLSEEYGSRATEDALLVMRHADTIDRPVVQTAIVVTHRGEQLLVRLAGVHVPAAAVTVDDRPHQTATWRPIPTERIDVRHE